MKAIGYARCSTEEQTLDVQKEQIRSYATLRGLELVDLIEDEGISGSKDLKRRPGGQELIKRIRKDSIQVVVILKLDRGFRNARDCLETVETWQRKEVALHILDVGGNTIDTNSAVGKFMLTVLAGAAEMERNLIKERTRDRLHSKMKHGDRVGAIRFGFDLDPQTPTKLIANRKEQSVIRKIMRWRNDGISYRGIAELLTDRGIPTKTGNARWVHTTVRRIVKRLESSQPGLALC